MSSLVRWRSAGASIRRAVSRQRDLLSSRVCLPITARSVHGSSLHRPDAAVQTHEQREPEQLHIDSPASPSTAFTASSPLSRSPITAPVSATATVINSSTTLPTHIHTYPITITPLTLPANPTFTDLHLPSHIDHRLAKFGLTRPTLIQAAAVPYLIQHPSLLTRGCPSDVLITDEPGTGKTLAFLLPLLSQLNPYLHALQAIVVVPTRALAIQLVKVADELNTGGRKARQRNPLRVDLSVGHVNPAMEATLTQPRRPPKLARLPVERAVDEGGEAGVPVGRVDVPSEFVSEHAEDGLLTGSDVSQLLIGTPQVLHELLVKRELFDTRELRYVVVDEADAVIGQGAEAQLMTELLAIRNKPLPSSTKSAAPRLPASNAASVTVSNTPTAGTQLAPPASTQVVLVTSIVTPELLRFSARHLSHHRHLLCPASVPTLTTKQRRTLLSHSTTQPTNITSRARAVLKQQLHLPSTLSHSYALYPQTTTREQKAQMLLQLLLAIRSSMRHSSPVVGQPQWIRHVGSRLKGGLSGVAPLSDRVPQTTLVLCRMAEDVFPLLSLLSSHLRISVLVQRSSRSELRDALSMTPPAEVVVAVESEVRGLDMKAVSHVINYTYRSEGMTAADYYRRAGRCGRKGAVWRHGRVVTMCREEAGDVERLERIVVGMGARGVTQVVVRGERLYERGRSRLYRNARLQQNRDDEHELTARQSSTNAVGDEGGVEQVEQSRELRPARYLDSLMGTNKRSARAST